MTQYRVLEKCVSLSPKHGPRLALVVIWGLAIAFALLSINKSSSANLAKTSLLRSLSMKPS